MIYHNVNRLSADVPETAHEGHAVTHVRYLTAREADIADVGRMSVVRCDIDGATFQVFPEELSPPSLVWCENPEHLSGAHGWRYTCLYPHDIPPEGDVSIIGHPLTVHD